ncbi:MAG TPA: IS66 family insertion sequence element accessory protein TnpB [Pirellulales bacterium]|nr:IS66 family insertion sequence element accessory protein TnpB [Pirellulales bacterium]
MPSLAARLAPLGAARIYLYAKSVDMRKSFDGLHAIIQAEFERDALGGDLFVFLNRRRDRLKLMVWEPDGWAMFYKRLEHGTFERPRPADDGANLELDATDLALLLAGVELKSVKRRPRYQRAGAIGAPQLAGN